MQMLFDLFRRRTDRVPLPRPPLHTAVALLFYRRAEMTTRVFARIRDAAPPRLYLIADGPREEVPGDQEACDATRAAIDSMIDWPCEVHRNYAERNMGVTKRMLTGIEWIFEREEKIIFLEDDSVADPTFFPFCEAMLDRYEHDPRVLHVNGASFDKDLPRGNKDYFFTKYAHPWAFGMWRRAWKLHDLHLKKWPQVHEAGTLRPILNVELEYEYWSAIFQRFYEMSESGSRITTWDYQWTFACFMNGVCVMPNVNLVTNIGFGAGAEHCVEEDNDYANLPTGPMPPPEKLRHPRQVKRNAASEKHIFNDSYLKQSYDPGEHYGKPVKAMIRRGRR